MNNSKYASLKRLYLVVGSLTAMLLAPFAQADQVIFTLGSVGLETGSWRYQVKRQDQAQACTRDSSKTCYFTYLDIQNSSDQTLTCTAQWQITIAGDFPNDSDTVNTIVPKRDAHVALIVQEAISVGTHSVFCKPGAAPESPVDAVPPYTPTPPPASTDPGRVSMDLGIFGPNPGITYQSDLDLFGGDAEYGVGSGFTSVSNSRSTATGPLHWGIFLTATPGADTGYLIAHGYLGVLGPNQQFAAYSFRGDGLTIPEGTYYQSQLILEGNDLNTYVARAESTATTTIHYRDVAAVNSGVKPGEFGIGAPSRLRIISDIARITAAGIWNRTGLPVNNPTVEVYVAASAEATTGYRIAQFRLATLPAGTSIPNVDESVPVDLASVPVGTYALLLLLKDDQDTVHQRFNISSSYTVMATTPPPSTTPPSTQPPTASPPAGGSGSGGGAFDLVWLFSLVLLGLFRSRGGLEPFAHGSRGADWTRKTDLQM